MKGGNRKKGKKYLHPYILSLYHLGGHLISWAVDKVLHHYVDLSLCVWGGLLLSDVISLLKLCEESCVVEYVTSMPLNVAAIS